MSSENVQKVWCINSGYSKHLCNGNSMFMSIFDTDISSVSLANNETTEVFVCLTVSFSAKVNFTLQNVPIYDALLVPELKPNLLSV